MAFGVKGGVLFKKVALPVKAEFEALSKEIAKHFKERGIKEKDAEEAVKWARKT